ncbi:MAG: hypothetical protein P8O16_05540 [Algoriphagus sp.]|uniref:hypothetical protein n=1 Tax=Algoriphagus sp. TaxID=1872435 RepID=UPI002606F372|nr:hypothetical protein [Algoriphagus sp.]MDG1276724.1 hypothetical protein [Algoriphagus sp.]
MEKNRLITLMTLPQHFDGENLTVHIVVIPRNANPFQDWNTGLPNPSKVMGFADFQPEFSLAIVKGTEDFPVENTTNPARKPLFVPVEVKKAEKKGILLKQISESFPVPVTDTSDKLQAPIPVEKSVKKYLPSSYRNSFNFTQPRHPNGVTDDSYECAIREKLPLQPVTPKEKVSWGKVFAQILKQPLLAEACGMIYKVTLPVKPDWFKNGGYLFAKITNDPYADVQFKQITSPNGQLVKQYAARIPELDSKKPRVVFAPVLFPVLVIKAPSTTPTIPLGPWDELFQEANTYDDGFAKIVHANQPISGNMLKESSDGFHPQKETGIRCGWDDEQILIWYIRQLTENPAASGSGERVDSALSVIGYHLDVKESSSGSVWESLNEVEISNTHSMAAFLPGKTTEIPYQVYPTKINGPAGANYWLPMYYAYWLGKSLVTEDQDALQIYKNDQDNGALIGGPENRKVEMNSTLKPKPLKTILRYGQSYDFRIRLTDISGGGPKIEDFPLNPAPSAATSVSFKRFVNPGMLRIVKPGHLLNQTGEYFNSTDLDETQFSANPEIVVERPLLEYPAVFFTMKYQKIGIDPIAELKSLSFSNNSLKPALPDPDVREVFIRVEVKSLRMDTSLSQSGKDSFITLYQTKRSFGESFDSNLTIPVEFIDVPVLNLGEEANPFFMANLKNSDLDAMDQLIIPTGRHVRVTMRAFASTEEDPDEYFGSISSDIELDSRYGKTTQLLFYKEPQNETELLAPYQNVPVVQGVFLKPDDVPTRKRNPFSILLKRETESGTPDVVSRLAEALGCLSKGLTLIAPKGERIAFGCSSRIRHSLAPDGSSITFASKAELQNHWIGGINYKIQRDWTWDSLVNDAFIISKRYKFRRDNDSEWRNLHNAGEVELKHTVSFEALQSDRFGRINRDYTRIIFLDAIEPKNDLKRPNGELRFPDEVWVEYRVTPNFKPNHASTASLELERLSLPTVLPPSQMPKLKSVGLAFSPYERTEDYSSSEVRRRHLWIEFEEPVSNPDDLYFCRVLANAPDQLLSNNSQDQFIAPEESPLSLDPEQTRVIIPDQSDDLAGIGAMQQMMPSLDSDRHFILPIPPGMHAESPELFGFFTYEFRVGHAYFDDKDDNLWSTAQGRFGRALRVTGIQHPAPTLLCSLNRDSEQMYISAPFAKAVFNGKNVTAKPPRTSLWAVLYAQVTQADGKDFRNILLGERIMKIGLKVKPSKKEEDKFKSIVDAGYKNNIVSKVLPSALTKNIAQLEIGHLIATFKENQPVGTAIFESQEIANRLAMFGLPEDSPLSVLVVEVFGNITNLFDHMEAYKDLDDSQVFHTILKKQNLQEMPETNSPEEMRPLSTSLGHFRILRTSPLTKVPFVCCPTC